MKAYKIVNNNFKDEVVFGMPFPFNQTNGEKKLIRALAGPEYESYDYYIQIW